MITYGQGQVSLDDNQTFISLKYTGSIRIIRENLDIIISGTRSTINITTASGESLPNILFSYKGKFVINYAYGLTNKVKNTIKLNNVGLLVYNTQNDSWNKSGVMYNKRDQMPAGDEIVQYDPSQFDEVAKTKANNKLKVRRL